MKMKSIDEFFRSCVGIDGAGPEAIIKFPQALFEGGMVGLYVMGFGGEVHSNGEITTETKIEGGEIYDRLRRNYP